MEEVKVTFIKRDEVVSVNTKDAKLVTISTGGGKTSVKEEDYPETIDFNYIFENKDKIIEMVKKDPIKDKIFFIKGTGVMTKKSGDLKPEDIEVKRQFVKAKYYTAGSSALKYFINELNKFYNDKKQTLIRDLKIFAGDTSFSVLGDTQKDYFSLNFEPEDIDIFFMKNDFCYRQKTGGVDIIYVRQKEIHKLIESFDLPICRVSYDINSNIWISSQCLYSLFTNSYILPKYLSTLETTEIFVDNMIKEKKLKDVKVYPGEMHRFVDRIYLKFQDRVKKYENRGYKAEYVENEEFVPWFFARLEYNDSETILI